MRKLLLLGLLSAAGCSSFVTPFDQKPTARADDPMLSTQEQKRIARFLYPFPDDELGPKSSSTDPDFLGPYGPYGR